MLWNAGAASMHIAAELWLWWRVIETMSIRSLKQKVRLINKGRENLIEITVVNLSCRVGN